LAAVRSLIGGRRDPAGAERAEAVNQALLHVLSAPEWEALTAKYFGKGE